MTGLMINKILNYFDELIPNPKCELNYCSDFEFLIAVVLSAQTTDYKVNLVTKELFKYDINSLKIEEINNIIKPIGMSLKKSYYVKSIAKYVSKYGIPKFKDELLKLDGVGNKTANLVLSTLYNEPYFAVDTHVTRVSKRLGLVSDNASVLEIEKKMYELIPRNLLNRSHHQFVLFGRYYCTSRNPKCKDCKLKSICKYYNSIK